MTELERAKAWLKKAQWGLAYYRKAWGEGVRGPNIEACIADNENCVLAALSWLWEEQEAARREWQPMHQVGKKIVFAYVPRGREPRTFPAYEHA